MTGAVVAWRMQRTGANLQGGESISPAGPFTCWPFHFEGPLLSRCSAFLLCFFSIAKLPFFSVYDLFLSAYARLRSFRHELSHISLMMSVR
ncbi:hypothetical protein L207DRAFT_160565 [Hyaloscypha variabilis F]|uniref:Uncharacterized protein n=1 Tax=Hyaloscypha variabilis (strain UAMH 11265 / GT02V1 / F) TaxID=1149755 RepID=A0A2J6S9Y5_HYAVF|nr:hypothetical protein L207DRAFT_160565 [Hyaloscypha variabilis F]